MTTAAVIQARMTSTRLPGKVMLPLAGEPAVYRIVERIKAMTAVDVICFSIPDGVEQRDLIDFAGGLDGVQVTRGPEEDILKRFALAAEATQADTVLRFWGDCPAVDPAVCSELIAAYGGGLKFATVPDKSGYPAGYEFQIIDADSILSADSEVVDFGERHHFLGIFASQPQRYPAFHLRHRPYLSDLSLLLDTRPDYERLQRVFSALYALNPVFGLTEVVDLAAREPELFAPET